MLYNITKTKNILFVIFLILFVVGATKYYRNISWFQVAGILSIFGLVLLYTRISSQIRSLLIVNVIFISCLVLMDFSIIDHDVLIAEILILLAFLVGRYFYKINDRFIFIEVSLLVFLAILFYPPAVFYIFFIFSIMFFHGMKKLSVYFLPLFCLVMYIGATFGISFLLGFDFIGFVKEQFSHFQLVYYDFSPQQLFLLVSLILFGIFALIDHYRMIFRQSLYNKRNYELILYFLIISSLLFILSKNALLFVLFPCSIIIGKYIYYQKNQKIQWFMILYFPVSALIWSVV